MSLFDQSEHHRRLEGYSAAFAVRCLQRGDRLAAEWNMEDAAMHRHLAYELSDTNDIAMDARGEALREGFFRQYGRYPSEGLHAT